MATTGKAVTHAAKKSVASGSKKVVGPTAHKSASSVHKSVAKSGAAVKKAVSKKPTHKVGSGKSTAPGQMRVSAKKTDLSAGLYLVKNGLAARLHF